MTDPTNELSDQTGLPGEPGSAEGETGFSDHDPVTATEGMPGAGTAGGASGDEGAMGDSGGDAGSETGLTGGDAGGLDSGESG